MFQKKLTDVYSKGDLANVSKRTMLLRVVAKNLKEQKIGLKMELKTDCSNFR